MKNEQEIVRSVFDAYIRDLKATSTKKDRPTFDMLEEVKNRAIKALEQQTDDCVSRQAMLDAITEIDGNINMDIYTDEVREIVKELPPVTPTHGTCKDCKHWKDSDGVYRRGVGAESKCPINIKEAYEGNFYCKWFEKRGNESGL